MGKSSDDEILGEPPEEQRCTKNDGRQWRCTSWKMTGRSLCQRHFLQQSNNNKKSKPKLKPDPKMGSKKKNDASRGADGCASDDSLEELFKDSDDSIEEMFEDKKKKPGKKKSIVDASVDILGIPPDGQRCTRNDGKQWQCPNWKLSGKNYCQRHALQQFEKNKKLKSKRKSKPVQQLQHHQEKRRIRSGQDADFAEGILRDNKKHQGNKMRNVGANDDCASDDSLEELFRDIDDFVDELLEDNGKQLGNKTTVDVRRSGSPIVDSTDELLQRNKEQRQRKKNADASADSFEGIVPNNKKLRENKQHYDASVDYVEEMNLNVKKQRRKKNNVGAQGSSSNDDFIEKVFLDSDDSVNKMLEDNTRIRGKKKTLNARSRQSDNSSLELIQDNQKEQANKKNVDSNKRRKHPSDASTEKKFQDNEKQLGNKKVNTKSRKSFGADYVEKMVPNDKKIIDAKRSRQSPASDPLAELTIIDKKLQGNKKKVDAQRTNLRDDGGNDDCRTCHQCKRSDKGVVVRCCRNQEDCCNGYCSPCMQRWLAYLDENSNKLSMGWKGMQP